MRVLTFDIEEWFHCDCISGSYDWDIYDKRIDHDTDKILQLLADHNQKATFFCLGWIAEKYPFIIKKIHSQGHQIGCHSNLHQLICRFTKEQFEADTVTALKRIEDITGEKIILYRAPAFSITKKFKWAFEVLVENGIEFDCSVFPAKHEYGGFPSLGISTPALLDVNGCLIKEFPVNAKKNHIQECCVLGRRIFQNITIPHYT